MKLWLAIAGLVLAGTVSNTRAEERFALVLSGASGGPKYAEQMREWRNAISTALIDRYGFPKDKVRVFVDETVKTGDSGTAQNVRAAMAELRKQMTRQDLLVIVLLGHGTYDGDIAKFNLVGPDLTAAEWKTLLDGVPARLVMVNTTEASFPFLARLSGANRVVITATDSAAQKYATVFPDYFAKAMTAASTDMDKNGRTSIFEVFAATSAAVKQHYEQRGQLTTERAVIDDNGDGVGREAEAPGPDGAMARLLYLDADTPAAANDPALAALIRRRRELEAEAEALKQQKGVLPAAAWTSEFERLMLELAKVSREIKGRS
ncbi:MAG TPA: hypothetical protein VNJ02_16730 [Vicinamibacterales bacterium]|nr:hypothetical protein [Vicinamibacterales bacterium]